MRGRRPGQQRLEVWPTALSAANCYVHAYHRHHEPVVGHHFSLMVLDESYRIHGVAIVGRPVGRKVQATRKKVTRLATDGFPNAASCLYAACAREVKRRFPGFVLQTFTLPTESGASLLAAGWKRDGTTPGRSWSVPTRPRQDRHPLGEKIRWVAP